MSLRVDEFDGTPEQYISYLEEQVISLRSHHASCYASAPHASTSASHAPQSSRHLLANQFLTASQHRLTEQPQQLKFIEFDHTTVNVKPTRLRAERSRWQENATALVQETPSGEEWFQALKKKGIHDIMSNGEAVSFLMGTQAPLRLSMPPESEPSTAPQSRLEQYATAAMRNEATASVALTLVNFQKFLLLSACFVLHEVDDSADAFAIVRLCIGSNATVKRCLDILKSCRYANELLDILYMKGWGLRGCELFLLCKPRPA